MSRNLIVWPNGRSASLLSVSYNNDKTHEVWRLWHNAPQSIEQCWQRFVFPNLETDRNPFK
jgi:hypothetical protein